MLKKRKTTKINPDTTDTLLGEGTIFEGNLKSEASIRLEGHITGDIECKGDVTIGETGNAQSSISARNVIIAGKVRGNVTAVEKLTIAATGSLQGNTKCKTLIIDDGGLFMGNSQMDVPSAQTGQPPKEADTPSFNRNYSDSAANM